MKNIIFIDFLTVFFPKKNIFINNEKQIIFEYITNVTKADYLPVDFFKSINQDKIEFIMIDNWIENNLVEFHELIKLNNIKLNLHKEFYFKNTNLSKRINCSNFLKTNNVNDYIFIANKDLKNNIDFAETLISFDKSIFVNESNGLSYNNLLEIKNRIECW